MPISVDHDEKRADVIAVAIRLIARSGIEAVTVREVADAAGCSTAIVSHYFRNKRELLLLTYDATIERATARGASSLAVHDNHPKAYLAEIMPLDEDRLTEWKVWIAFWAKAAADQQIADTQRECVRRTRGVIASMLAEEKAKGRILGNIDCSHQGLRLLTTIIGMAVQVVFDVSDWPSERQHALIDAELRALYRNPEYARLPTHSSIAAE